MEILLIACMLAYTAGAQSEQSKLGLSKAQRAVMRERTRHEKAIQKIADKHGDEAIPSNGSASPWKDGPGAKSSNGVSDTFLSGYRAGRPARQPFGHRTGAKAGQGVTWAQDTWRDAWQAYRERRRREGQVGPELVTVPLPPDYPPNVPPVPVSPPTAVAATQKPNAPPADGDSKTGAADPAPAEKPAAEPAVETGPPETTAPPIEAQPAEPQGVGRMAAEVTYESVADESDELSLMCEDDAHVYDRIRARSEREIGRGDDLVVKMQASGFGDKVIGWVARCKEQYKVILAQVDSLQTNTVAQGEQVVKAKALLEAGQGVYADIAKDMESVAVRDAYVSDAVDAEDTNPESEVYETKAAA